MLARRTRFSGQRLADSKHTGVCTNRLVFLRNHYDRFTVHNRFSLLVNTGSRERHAAASDIDRRDFDSRDDHIAYPHRM